MLDGDGREHREGLVRALAIVCAGILATGSSAAAQAEPPCPAPPSGKAFAEELILYKERRYFDGVFAMARDGEMLVSASAGVADPHSGTTYTDNQRVRLASISKMFAATMAMQLVEEGTLSLDDTLVAMLPEFDAAYSGQVTLDHLLSHSSGIPNMQYTDASTALEERILWHGPNGSSPPLADFMQLFRTADLQFAPGSQQRYSNSNYTLLEAIIERADKRSYSESLTSRILQPLALSDTGIAIYGDFVPGLVQGRMRDLDAAAPAQLHQLRSDRGTV